MTDSPEHLILPAAPPLPEPEANPGLWMSALPMVASAAGIAVFASMNGAMRTRGLIAGGVFMLAALAFVWVQFDRHRRQRRAVVRRTREDYLHQLNKARTEVRRARAHQHDTQLRCHPSPEMLATVLATYGPAWEAQVPLRLGHTTVRLDPPLTVASEDSSDKPDVFTRQSLEQLIRIYSQLPGPRLASGKVIRVKSLAAARAVLLSAAHTRHPQEWALAVITEDWHEWDWLKWLPHAHSDAIYDQAGGRRLVVASANEFTQIRDQRPAVVLTDDTACLTDHDVALLIDPKADPGDTCSRGLAETIARQLTAYASRQSPRDFFSLHGINPADIRPATALPAQPLCVPIGVSEDQPVWLDLKEAALSGMGPHGLVIGATGSGKSELLRTIVVGLAATHRVDHLNLVLIDFKGGATFAGLAQLPHTSAVITNLEEDLSLADRMADALVGELTRRQLLLRQAGNLTSLPAYAEARRNQPELPPMPSLVIVVDEFSELLSARPEFTELFVMIGRLGRSLGIHLLLASQRLDEGRLQGLEAHLSYRIALRTFSAIESRVVLGASDAYELPSQPGLGLLKGGPEELVRFQSTYVSGPAPHTGAPPEAVPWTVQELPRRQIEAEAGTVLERIVAAHRGSATQAHQVWLPPLTESPQLTYCVSHSHGLRLAVGIVDLPRQQRRSPLQIDLSQAGGHLGVAGAPRAGVSTMLTTVAATLAWSHSGAEVQFLVIDEPGSLSALRSWPHCSAYASNNPDLIRRITQEVGDLIPQRQSGEPDDWGRVFVVIDAWEQTRTTYPELAELAHQIASHGLAVGVHLLLGLRRWGELRMGLRDAIGSRLELRLGDPLDSEVDHRKAASLPKQPGYGLTADGHPFLAALPELASGSIDAELRKQYDAAPQLTTLPDHVHLATLTPTDGLRLGQGERSAHPILWSPADDPHLLIVGDAGSGKTNLLRTLLSEIQRIHTATDAQVLLLDPRRRLTDALDPSYNLGTEVGQLITHLASQRIRSTWEGPRIYLIIDDYEISAATIDLTPLRELLSQALDIGLHLIIARSSAGAARAIYEPLLQSIRDLAGPGVLLSGNKDEGPLIHGATPEQLPPGRGRWLSRSRQEYLQIAVSSPRHSETTQNYERIRHG